MKQRQRGRPRKPGQFNSGGGNFGGGNNSNPNRSFESAGPDVKIRGSAQTIFEKYQQLARDATQSGDRVLGENYLQHAEHYFRVMKAMQPNFVPRVEPDATFDEDDVGDGNQSEDEGDEQDGAQAQNGGHVNGGQQNGQQNRDYNGNGQGNGQRNTNGQQREYQARDNQNRDGQQRDVQQRDYQARDNQQRDGQNQNGQPRERNRDWQPREPRDNQNRDNQSRDQQQPREQQPRGDYRDNNQQSDGQPRGEYRERPPRDFQPREPREPQEPRGEGQPRDFQPREPRPPRREFRRDENRAPRQDEQPAPSLLDTIDTSAQGDGPMELVPVARQEVDQPDAGLARALSRGAEPMPIVAVAPMATEAAIRVEDPPKPPKAAPVRRAAKIVADAPVTDTVDAPTEPKVRKPRRPRFVASAGDEGGTEMATETAE